LKGSFEGSVLKWLKRLAWKASRDVNSVRGGSNPLTSAKKIKKYGKPKARMIIKNSAKLIFSFLIKREIYGLFF
jgi:hypothetical protein